LPGSPLSRLAALALIGLSGCVAPRHLDSGIALELNAVVIPAGSAHTVFQGGRQVGGASTLEPYCELEIETVSEQAQGVSPVRLQVTGVRQALLKDPITRIPALIAGFSCSDPVFRETVWRLAPDRPSPVLWLRCIAPYFNCRIGGPLTPEQIQAVVGPAIRITRASTGTTP
jgi:hypothetical protein